MLTNRLSRLMGERRVSIQDIHRATRISRTTLTDLYYDRRRGIDFSTLDRLCDFFGTGPSELLEWHPTSSDLSTAARSSGKAEA